MENLTKNEQRSVDAALRLINVIEDGDNDVLQQATDRQVLINTGEGWRLEGSVGRALSDAIAAGLNALGKVGVRDYYGNYVPSRTEVKAGTKGSLAFVEAQSGEDWAKAIAAVK